MQALLIFVPAILCTTMMGLGQQSALIEKSKWLLVCSGIISFLVPFALEAAGVFPTTIAIDAGKITMTSGFIEIGGVATWIGLIVPHALVIGAARVVPKSLMMDQRGEVRRGH